MFLKRRMDILYLQVLRLRVEVEVKIEDVLEVC